MEKPLKLLIITSILFIAYSGNAQWYQQDSGTTNNLNSIFCTSLDTVYICGANGTILRTTNGGTTWETLNSGTNNLLNSIFFANNETGYTAGEKIILKTIDHGENWFIVYIDTIAAIPYFYSTFFLNADTGFAVGYNPIFNTIDGGINWMQYSPQPQFYYTFLKSIFFPTNKIGYTVGFIHGFGYNEGIIGKTTDSGNNWFFIKPPFSDTNSLFISKSLLTVFFIDSLKGWMGGGSYTSVFSNYRKLFKTIDGGINWDTLTTPFLYDINSVFFANEQIGYVADDSGHIYNTKDKGALWQLQTFIPNKSIKSLHCIDSNICYAVGDSGLILKTINGGEFLNEFKIINQIQIYPNPINNITTIQYSLQKPAIVNLYLKDIYGRKIKEIACQTQHQGSYNINFDATNLKNGIYFCILETSSTVRTTKVIVAK